MMIAAQSLIVAWLVLQLAPRRGHGNSPPPLAPMATLASLAAALLVQVPFMDGVSAAMALRGLIGDPSITTVQLLVLSLAGRTPAALSRGWVAPAALVLLGLLLYPAALGALDWDIYRAGYQPALLLALLALPALAAWSRGQSLALWLLGIDLLAFAAGLPESTNLWDSLIDPLLFLAALVLLIRYAVRNFRSRAAP